MVRASIFFYYFCLAGCALVCWNWKIDTVMNYDFVYVIATRATTTTMPTTSTTTMRRRRCEGIRGWLGLCFCFVLFFFCIRAHIRTLPRNTCNKYIKMEKTYLWGEQWAPRFGYTMHALSHTAKCATVAQSRTLRERFRILSLQVIQHTYTYVLCTYLS